MELVKIRLKESKDEPFIFNSWLQSNRVRHPNMPKSDYFSHYKILITEMLYKSIVMIACDPSDPEFIYGYLVVRPLDDVKIIHYAYVKKPFRKFGILKKLLSECQIDLSNPICVTTKGPDFIKYQMVYKPELKTI